MVRGKGRVRQRIVLFFVGLFLLWLPPVAAAQIYKCDGKWTNSPCNENSKPVEGLPVVSRAEVIIPDIPAQNEKSNSSRKLVTVKYRSSPVNVENYEFHSTSRSSFINEFWYDPSEGHLIINLNDTNYQYCEVPPDIVDNLLSSDSHGSFYNEQIKEKYRCDEEEVYEPCTVLDHFRAVPRLEESSHHIQKTEFDHIYDSSITVTGQGRVSVRLYTVELTLADDVRKQQKTIRSFTLPACGGTVTFRHKLNLKRGSYGYTVVNMGNFKGYERVVPCQ